MTFIMFKICYFLLMYFSSRSESIEKFNALGRIFEEWGCKFRPCFPKKVKAVVFLNSSWKIWKKHGIEESDEWQYKYSFLKQVGQTDELCRCAKTLPLGKLVSILTLKFNKYKFEQHSIAFVLAVSVIKVSYSYVLC